MCSAEEHQLSIGAPEYALQQEYSGSRESNAKVYLHVATVDPLLGGRRTVFTRTDAIMIVNYQQYMASYWGDGGLSISTHCRDSVPISANIVAESVSDISGLDTI